MFKEKLFRLATFSMQQKPVKVKSSFVKGISFNFEYTVFKGTEKLDGITFVGPEKKNNEFVEFGQINRTIHQSLMLATSVITQGQVTEVIKTFFDDNIKLGTMKHLNKNVKFISVQCS